MDNLIVIIFFIILVTTVIMVGTSLFTNVYVPWRMRRYVKEKEL